MTRAIRSIVAMAACAACLRAQDTPAAKPVEAPKPPEGFTAIFNGKDLTGWHGWAIHSKGGSPADVAKLSAEERKAKVEEWTEDAKKHWRVENGVLINDGEGAYLTTDKDYSDYELLIDWKIGPKIDRGIYLKHSPQVQVWDPTEPDPSGLGKALGSGGLWNNGKGNPGRDPLVKADNPPGEWNTFRILQVGDRTTIHLNGKLVVKNARLENYWDRKSPLPRAGKVLLQTHSPKGDAHWRNIFVRELKPAEALKALAAAYDDESSFTKLFNGTDLKDWKGAVDNYEVADGAIRCKPGKGGVLHTPKDYTDFVVRLEYKVPPGGNNGLAIRYPGTGDTAYTGMCELQILDDTAEKYSKLDPRQYNLSAYGMTAAKRGYMQPVGEWNMAEVTVKGSTIVAELNGSKVLDTDLSKVTEFMANKPHPGKDNAKGSFGFAGHGDAVSFRNIRIKEITAK